MKSDTSASSHTGSDSEKRSRDEKLKQLEESIQTREQAKARIEHDLSLKRSEQQQLKQKMDAESSIVAQQKRRIQNNEQILGRALSIDEAIQRRKKIESTIEEMQKEARFVEQKSQEVQNKLYEVQNDRSTKENNLQNKRFYLSQINQELNPSGYQSATAEIRMLESELDREEPLLRRAQEDARRFDARLYDLQLQLKQFKHQLREAEQNETVARRLEGVVAENQRLNGEVRIKEREVEKMAEDLKKITKTVTTLEDRVKRADAELTQDVTARNRAKAE